MSEIIPTMIDEGIDQLAHWSDDRRTEFCETFEQRVLFASFILEATALGLFEEAKKRFFVGAQKVFPRFPKPMVTSVTMNFVGEKVTEINVGCVQDSYNYRTGTNDSGAEKLTGRTSQELNKIVAQRLEGLLVELPASQSTVRIIKPELADDMTKLRKLEAKAQEIKKVLTDLQQPVDVTDYLGKLVDDFLADMKKRQATKRRKNELYGRTSSEVSALRDKVNKALYKGIPALQEATMDVVQDLHDQATALLQLNRRVTETVKFGDSEAAMEALKQFEKDEIEMAPAMQTRFKAVVSKLRSRYKISKKKATKKVTKKAGRK